MSKYFRPPMIRRYGLVLLGVAIALGAKILLDPYIAAEEPFLLFLAVVTLSAWYGGFVPGFLATLLAALTAEYFFIGPYFTFEPHHFIDDPRLMLFVLEGIVVSLLVSRVHAAMAQRRLSQRRYQQIVETAEEGIWLLDPRWTTRFANAAMASMLGFQPSDILNQSIFEFMDADDQRSIRNLLQPGQSRAGRRHEIKFRRRDGAPLWTFVSGSAMTDEDDDFTGCLLMVTDISARKSVEQELARHRDHLEELVLRRTEALQESYERLRLSERMAMLGTLSAGLGHDMGNLLMPLRVRLDAIESRGMPHELEEDVQAIRASTEYLQRLTNGLRLLTLNPDESGRSGESTDLRAWWLDVASFYKNALPRGAALESQFAEHAEFVRVPRHLLTQAVFNLVHNAGQALDSRNALDPRNDGKRGKVVVWAQPDDDGRRVRLGVTDDGPGMSEDVKRRCLEPFFTTKTPDKSSGLGLALVRLIVQRVGGSIEIDSHPGRGTTFVLTLPARANEEPRRQSLARAVSEPNPAGA